MNQRTIELPFIWPDSRRLAGCAGPAPDMDSLFAESQLVLGVVHGTTEASLARLRKMLAAKPDGSGNGQPAAPLPEKKIRLIVTLYPACPTSAEALMGMLSLTENQPSLEVRLATCELLSGPENPLACYKTPDALPTVLFGTTASLEELSEGPSHLTLAFTPEPVLAAEWRKWFDVRWLKAARLTQQRTTIPRLVLPEGTLEAAQQWTAYKGLLVEDEREEAVVVTVDPATGEVSAQSADGAAVATISAENKLPKLSPVYRKLAQLFEKGHLVSVDKATRLPPFEVPVTPKWFGLETLKQTGSVRRQVSYRISALTQDELKRLENRRKKTGELLDLFSFSLADGQRWMPSTAEELFRQENDRINREAKDVLSQLIAGDLGKFMASRRNDVGDDANRMLHDLFPDRTISDDVLDEIMKELQKRFEQAQQQSLLPRLSFSRISLPQPQDTAWKSQLGSALNLLLSIVRYPRKACRNGPYFGRGMTAKPPEILKAMNVLNDPFVGQFEQSEARTIAEAELQRIDSIEESEAPADEKCEQLFELLGHNVSGSATESSLGVETGTSGSENR